MKILSIEIGYSRTIICEVDSQTKKVTQMFIVPTPDHVLDDGLLRNEDGFAAQVRDALDARGIKTKQVIFTVTGNRIASRDVEILYVKRNKIAEIVGTNEADYFPMDLKNYRVAYTILEVMRAKASEEEVAAEFMEGAEEIDEGLSKKERKKLEKERKKRKAKEEKEKARAAKRKKNKKDDDRTGYRLSVLAMPREMIGAYTRFAKKCGLELKDIDYNGNSLYQAMKRECAEGVQALIKINERRTQVLVLVGGNVVMSRFVPYGMDETVAEIYDEGYILPTATYDEAITYLKSQPVLPSVVEEANTEMITGILKVLELYESAHPLQQIDRIVLVGLGATIKSYRDMLSREIGMDVDVLTELTGFHIPKDERTEEVGEYVSCLGAQIAPADFFHVERSAKRAFGVDIDDLTRLAMATLLLLAVALVATGVVGYMAERNKNNALKMRLRNYAPTLTAYQEYTLSKQAAQYMQNAYDTTQLPTVTLVEFIEELEDKMPASSMVTSFIADREKVTISMTARDKEEAADMIMQMRTFESLAEVSVSGITDSSSDVTAVGGGNVTFTIVGTYHVPEEETAQEAAPEAEAPVQTLQEQMDTLP